jgi:hypothetical protein
MSALAANGASRSEAAPVHVSRPAPGPRPNIRVTRGPFGSTEWQTGCYVQLESSVGIVDGGLDPRISGGARKVGTNFAVDLLAAETRDDRPLSTPEAAGGGGQRPAFTGVYRPATIASVDLCMAALV